MVVHPSAFVRKKTSISTHNMTAEGKTYQQLLCSSPSQSSWGGDEHGNPGHSHLSRTSAGFCVPPARDQTWHATYSIHTRATTNSLDCCEEHFLQTQWVRNRKMQSAVRNVFEFLLLALHRPQLRPTNLRSGIHVYRVEQAACKPRVYCGNIDDHGGAGAQLFNPSSFLMLYES